MVTGCRAAAPASVLRPEARQPGFLAWTHPYGGLLGAQVVRAGCAARRPREFLGLMLDWIKRTYRRTTPMFVRRSRTAGWLKRRLYRSLPYDAVYGADYYSVAVEGAAASSAIAIADTISRDLRPRSVVDVGCGTGAILQAVLSTGCSGIGLDYSDAALALCRQRQLAVRKTDIARQKAEGAGRFDLAMSFEVAEHLPSAFAESYVDLLTGIADTVVVTAAPPGQGGTDHLNEQPREYWLEKFEQRGFLENVELTHRWRR